MSMAQSERQWPAAGKPAILSPEPPVCWSDYPALLEMAQLLLATRRERFPKQVAAGDLDQDAANLELSAFEDLVADWQFICTGEGEPGCIGSEQLRREALDDCITRIAAHAAQFGWTERLTDQAHSVIALRWHMERGRKTISMARLTHQIRDDLREARYATN